MRPATKVVATALTVAMFGCSSPAPAEQEGEEVVAAVCEARAAAAGGDADGARRTFVNNAHGRLHELAAETGRVDRRAEARLLEAKQRVEAVLEEPGPDFADRLERLAVAAAEAAEVVDDERPAGC